MILFKVDASASLFVQKTTLYFTNDRKVVNLIARMMSTNFIGNSELE